MTTLNDFFLDMFLSEAIIGADAARGSRSFFTTSFFTTPFFTTSFFTRLPHEDIGVVLEACRVGRRRHHVIQTRDGSRIAARIERLGGI